MSTPQQRAKRAAAARKRKNAAISRAVRAQSVPYALTGTGAYRRRQAVPGGKARSNRSLVPASLGSTLGGALGTLAGGPAGGAIGSFLGHGAQQLVKYITGFGDYNVSVNSLMGPAFSPPELINKSKEGVCLRHREYIGDVFASSAFTLQSYDIQPGLNTSFPWLAQVASNFEEYMLTGLVYEYKTLSADYTTASSAALGYVVMATQYNVLAPNFQDKKVMENYEFANSAKPSETFIHPVECKRSLNPISELFVRTGSPPANSDQRLYDLGNFQIATGGNTGTGVIGELWATFEICLFKPKLVGTIGSELLTDHYLATTGITNTSYFGTNRTLAPGSAGFTSVTLNRQVQFPANTTDGSYFLFYQVSGTAAALTRPTVSFTNCTALSVWQNDTATFIDQSGVTSLVYFYGVVVQITAGSAQISFGSGGAVLPTSPTAMDLWITQINGSILT